jgi:hypothetical protein
MHVARPSSLEEYASWYLQRESRKANAAAAQIRDSPVATLRTLHAGKVRPWFDRATRWQIVEMDPADLGRLVFLESPWTTCEQLVVPDGPNYRLLRRVARNAIRGAYLSRPAASRHQTYYDQLAAGRLKLSGADRIAICSAGASEVSTNPEAGYYLLDGVGRCLPYMILIAERRPVPRLVEAFLAERIP